MDKPNQNPNSNLRLALLKCQGGTRAVEPTAMSLGPRIMPRAVTCIGKGIGHLPIPPLDLWSLRAFLEQK